MKAVVTAVFNVATVQIMGDDGEPKAEAWKLTQDDGDGPVPAAEAVLERRGWSVVGDWQATAGGISGGVWEAEVERECEGHESTRGDLMGESFYCDGTCR